MPSPIKDERLYQELRRQGDSQEKAARISNAAALQGRPGVGRKGGESGSYQDWTGTTISYERPICARAQEEGERAWSQGLFKVEQEQAHLENP